MKKLRNFKSKTNYQNSGSLVLKLNFNKVLTLAFLFSMSFFQGIVAKSISYSGFENNEPIILNQQIEISGVVSDKDGPLPGVNVLVKGTSNGALTDFDGNYSISVESNAVLVFSYIGYKTKEVVVDGETTINVMLEANTENLDEVVVLGYSTRKKGDVTGSVSTVKAGDIEKSGSKDLVKSLAGKVSGLIISDRGGTPGSGETTLLIRGKSTLGNNAPLILIDGIVASSFSHLSPQDIESLTVLKDGAAAIYGARAANGVILVTTKRGKNGKTKINLSTSYTVSSFSAEPSLMSSEQFAIYNNEIEERFGRNATYTEEDIVKYANGIDPINYPNTNWADETFSKTSPESRTSLSLSGGNENVNYFVSGDMIRQKGMYKSGDLKFDQNQIRSNLDIKIIDDLKLGVDLSGRFGETVEPGIGTSYIYKNIYNNFPTEVAVYPNGLIAWGGENGANPVIMSSDETGFEKQVDTDLRGKISIDYDLNKLAEGLKFKGFAGMRRMNYDQKYWYSPWTVYSYLEGSDEYVAQPGFSQDGNENILRESFWKYNELMLNATVYYSKTINDKHSFSGFVGYEQTTSDQRNFWVEKKGFPDSEHSELFAGDTDGQTSDGTSYEWARVNYFGSFSYDYMKKYYVDITLRHDGSSNFGPGNRFGTFPGIALSWSIDKESFMEDVSWVNSLKLRSSWAKMGNDRISGFQYLTQYNYAGNVGALPNYYNFGGEYYNGYSSIGVAAANPDITWEAADMKNIGLNFTLLDSRLTGDFNYFYQKREDILITRNASIPDYTGLTLPQENIGKVDNYGWEFELGWNDTIEDLAYNIGFNFTQAKNEVVYMDEAENVIDAMKQEGHPMDSYLIYPTNGLFQNQAQVDAEPAKLAGTVPGEPYYIDTNENGRIDAGDRIRSYSSNVPEVQYGIHGGLNYKNWNFSFLFQGQAKAKMQVFFEGNGALPDFLYDQRWTPENTDARYPRAFANGDAYSSSLNGPENFQGADLWLRDASYLRLKEVELGYAIPKDITRFADVKVYVRGYNVLTMFSDIYDLGLDPEAEGYNSFRQSRYPSLKSFTFGLNFNF
ncbi:TonB-dependent receptor [Lutibacter sp. A80]|uniref:SusC/RagA family TonB-linked outer membrane protein n=1 Tax=Lutibacter sp. A80 TaxID=2918453 RepID=UPI001F06D093|nr:TonB-dependent receptor [Lutibacter sp. A80]UMB61706.1 TonB-dependent receptor [Lutibacter sp. A80]